MTGESLLENALYFLALINPASKIFMLSSVEPPLSFRRLAHISAISSLVALLILLIAAGLGQFLLHTVFHVEIYSLKVAGGIVLFIVGLTAVRRGRFYEQDLHHGVSDISIVPLGAPLIAGPGTITAAISFSTELTVEHAMLALTLALLANYLLMLTSMGVGRFLGRINAIGPLIRITGLIVAAVAVQMILGGAADWLHQEFRSLPL